VVWGQQGGELVPQGLDDAGWQGGHGFLVGVWWHMPRMQANPCLHSQIGLPRLLAQPLKQSWLPIAAGGACVAESSDGGPR
jgi:hypothetical protein